MPLPVAIFVTLPANLCAQSSQSIAKSRVKDAYRQSSCPSPIQRPFPYHSLSHDITEAGYDRRCDSLHVSTGTEQAIISRGERSRHRQVGNQVTFVLSGFFSSCLKYLYRTPKL
jgi:hypothetical protein